MPAPKPKSLALLAMMRPAKKAPPGGEGGDAPGADLEGAMGDLLAAIRTDDPGAMADAFRAAMDLADSDDGGGTPEAEPA